MRDATSAAGARRGRLHDDGKLFVFPPAGPKYEIMDPLTGANDGVVVRPKGAQHFALSQALDYYGASSSSKKGKTTLTEWSYPGKKVLQRTLDPGLAGLGHGNGERSAARLQKQIGHLQLSRALDRRGLVLQSLAATGGRAGPRQTSMAFELDRAGRRLVLGHADGSVTVTDLKTGRTRTLNGRHSAEVIGVGFTPDGRTIVSSGPGQAGARLGRGFRAASRRPSRGTRARSTAWPSLPTARRRTRTASTAR